MVWRRARRAQILPMVATVGVLALSVGESRNRVEPAEPAGQAAAAWPFHLEWEQPAGQGAISEYRICEGEQCHVLAPYQVSGSQLRAALPAYAPGEHRLQLLACNPVGCTPGTPELYIRVHAGTGRRPPLDVLEGPRIPVGR